MLPVLRSRALVAEGSVAVEMAMVLSVAFQRVLILARAVAPAIQDIGMGLA